MSRTAACVLVLSCLAGQIAGTEYFAICVGEDGHVPLEDTRIGICGYTLDCLREALAPLGVTDVLRSPLAVCCPCSDIPLPSRPPDGVSVRAGQERPAQRNLSHAVIDDVHRVRPDVCASAASRVSRFMSAPPLRAGPRALCTVILLV